MTTEQASPTLAPWWQTFFDDAYRRASAPMLSPERTAVDVAGVGALVAEHLRAEHLTVEHRSEGAIGAPHVLPRVLDVCGGDGRVAAPLAALGWDVTVLDASAAMIAAGRDRYPDLPFVEGDSRALPFAEGAFDVALNLFSAFGYFDDDAEHVGMLREIRRCLRPGGLLIMDLTHRDHFISTLAQPCTWYMDEDGSPIWRACVFDAIEGVSHERLSFISAEGFLEERAWRCRIFTATEIAHMLRAAGFSPLSWHGGLDLSPFAPDLPGLTVAAQKPFTSL
jgi:SAM-dependent methyltransferase